MGGDLCQKREAPSADLSSGRGQAGATLRASVVTLAWV